MNTNTDQQIVILGAGFAGISVAHHLAILGHPSTVFEKCDTYGGLCGSFSIDDFTFDKFIHLSFPDDDYIKNKFSDNNRVIEHIPYPSNYYHGLWIRHPAQNNLAPLPPDEKVKIISDFIKRKNTPVENIKNYDEWLRVQYGDYFAEHFPFEYTKKYWGCQPKALETKWVGRRMYSPNIEEILLGSYATQDTCFYYAKKMYYPSNGGFKSFLSSSLYNISVVYNKNVVDIDQAKKIVTFSDGTYERYDILISTLPMTELVSMAHNVPQKIAKAAECLRHTSGYYISLGFSSPDIAKYLWFYIYDADIPPARVYSPNLKSARNAPDGCSSLQAEIFWANNTKAPDKQKMLDSTVAKLMDMGLFTANELLFADIRYQKFANIIFDHGIYGHRKIVSEYLDSVGIISIGRFGRWDYLWSHQAYMDGIKTAKRIHDAF